MAENQLMFGLKRQYARTLGRIERVEDCGEDLAHLGAVIRMFRPDADLSAITPLCPARPYRPHRERWSRDALAILRKANGPMTPRALARRVLSGRGLPLTRPYLQRVECSLHAVLERLEGRGLVRVSNEWKRWGVAP